MDPDAEQSAAAFPDEGPSAFGDVDKTASMNGDVQSQFDQMRSRRGSLEAAAKNQRRRTSLQGVA